MSDGYGRRPEWKQPTPAQELQALCSCLEGHFANWSEGIIEHDEFSKAFAEVFDGIKAVNAHIKVTGRSDAW